MRKLLMSTAVLLFVGCSDPGGTTHLEAGPLTATPTYAAPQLIGVAAVRLPGAQNDEPAPGVEACVLDRESSLCTRSANDGSYTLGPLTPRARSKVRYTKTGLLPLNVEYEIPEHSTAADVFLFSAATIAESARRLGVQHDEAASAGVVISANGMNYDGIFPLNGVRARTLGKAKFTYAALANELDTTLEATTASGWGIALGLEPGPLELEFSHIDPTVTCGRLTSRAGTLESSFVVETLPGELTQTTVYCVR